MSEEYERVDDSEYETIDSEYEVASDDSEYEVIDEEYEVVDDDVEVVVKPIYKMSDFEVFINSIYELHLLNEKIRVLNKEIKKYKQILKEYGIDKRKVREKIRIMSRELNKLRERRKIVRVQLYESCENKRISKNACLNCRFEKECLLALRHLNKRRERKIRKWFR